jgi:hypothetical protein
LKRLQKYQKISLKLGFFDERTSIHIADLSNYAVTHESKGSNGGEYRV